MPSGGGSLTNGVAGNSVLGGEELCMAGGLGASWGWGWGWRVIERQLEVTAKAQTGFGLYLQATGSHEMYVGMMHFALLENN